MRSHHHLQIEEIEETVARLTQLALHAHALAERTGSLPPVAGSAGAARHERVRRLREVTTLVQRVLLSVAALDLDLAASGTVVVPPSSSLPSSTPTPLPRGRAALPWQRLRAG